MATAAAARLSSIRSPLLTPTLEHLFTSTKLPDRPRKWPTQWLKEEHFVDHLSSILNDGGWRVSFLQQHVPASPKYTILSAQFLFPKVLDASRFINDICYLSEIEQHHPKLTLDPIRSGFVVSVDTHTHSATPALFMDAIGLDPASLPKVVPGITLRDVRLAKLISTYFTEQMPSFESPPSLKVSTEDFIPSWEVFKTMLLESVVSNVKMEQLPEAHS
ncbi:hypothetical protein DL96DRAFT_1602772 [Flagelloscypha sp. PMI_526]|nr:hypothetical protein DL96DRAFT_1602772 [Flagelloscypha sp. PMI_526]